MASNPYVNKVEYAGQTLMDLTEDTVTPSDVLSGVTFHDRSGASQQGSLITHNVYDGLDSSSSSDALSANQGKALDTNKLNYYEIANQSNLNNFLSSGIYRSPSTTSGVGSLTNCPVSVPFTMIVTGTGSSTGCVQSVIIDGAIYTRRSTSSGFGYWYRFNGTAVN